MTASKFSMIVVWRRTLCDYRVPVLRPSSPKDSPFPERSHEDIFLRIELVKSVNPRGNKQKKADR